MENSNAFRVRASYRRYLLQGIMAQPMDWHVAHHSGDTNDKVEKGTGALFAFAEDSFEVVYTMAHLVAAYCVLVAYYKPASIIVAVMMLVTGWVIFRFDRVLIPRYEALSLAENQIAEKVLDSITNITTVIILRVEALVFNAIMHRVEEPYQLYRSTSIRNEWKWFFVSLCCKATIVTVLMGYFAQQYFSDSVILGGTVFLLFNSTQKLSEVFNQFAGIYGDIVQRRAKIMNTELLSQEFKPASLTNHVLPASWHFLEVQGLSFSYEGNEGGKLHLDNLSFRLERGKRYAFVGKSGSGKTTLLKVIRDLYHPQTGELLVDGHLVPDGFAGIARAIALAPQNPEIFATTIMDNITMGAEYAFGLVQRYVAMACFTQVVEDLPQKYESKNREKGVNLSGGQQQRLALARALIAADAKDMLLLDEPTSSLDTATEGRVYRNIFQGFQGKTIISSIHRLHLLPLFDQIIMFDEGKIVASGTLPELLASCHQFQELWQEYHNQ